MNNGDHDNRSPDDAIRVELTSSGQLALDLALTAKAMRRHLEDTVAAAHGGMATWTVLGHVLALGEATQADLARSVGIAGSTLTKRLQRMEEDGLVYRVDDPSDGRRLLVAVTRLGMDAYQRYHQQATEEGNVMMAGLGEEDIEMLRRVLARIRGNLVLATGSDEMADHEFRNRVRLPGARAQ